MDPVPSSAIYDATAGGVSVLLVTGGSTGDVLTRQSDGTYLPAPPAGAGSYLPLSGGTLSGALGVTNINGPGGAASLVLNNTGSGGIFLAFVGSNRAWVGNGGVGFYLAAYPMNDNLYDLGLTGGTQRYWRTLYVNAITCVGQVTAGPVISSGPMCAGSYTFGTLPSAAANARKFVNVVDSSVNTIGSAVAGGGSYDVTVRSDGTNWIVWSGVASGGVSVSDAAYLALALGGP